MLFRSDLFWFDIPLGSFDVGLGLEYLKSLGKDPRVYIAWSNDVDFSSKKVRDYSEYLELIEVDSDLGIISEPSLEQIDEQPSFLALDADLNIVQVVDLMDQVINQREPHLDDKPIIDKLNIPLPTTVSEYALTELMIMIDQIMQNRN